MMLYERFDADEETPVQFVGVYTTHWQSEWGQPEVMFREADYNPERLQAENARLREALERTLAFGFHATFDAKASYTIRKEQEWRTFVQQEQAALSTPADDWLAQHDAEGDAKICELGNEVIRLTKLVARLRYVLSGIAQASFCRDPNCTEDDPHCDAMVARQALADTGSDDWLQK
jgi:hypothetical protein